MWATVCRPLQLRQETHMIQIIRLTGPLGLANLSGALIGGGLSASWTGVNGTRKGGKEVHMYSQSSRKRIESRNARLALGPLNTRDRDTGHSACDCKLLLRETGTLALAT